jgi:alkylation response protein AidB-like acyl-CoA dehydrogenase
VTRNIDDWLDTAKALAPLISEAALKRGSATDIGSDVMDQIRASGLPWILVPEELGGGGGDLLDMVAVIEEISRADGATGWVYFVHMSTAAIVGSMLPDDGVKKVFSSPSLPLFAGMFAPLGTASPGDDGYSFSGRYSFGSGIQYADWIVAGAIPKYQEQPVLRENGDVDHRVFLVRAEDVRLLGNWDTIGLRATGSFDFEIAGTTIPAELTLAVPPRPHRGRPLFAVGYKGINGAGHAAVPLGIAKRALEEVARVGAKRRGQAKAAVVDQQLFKHGFAFHDAALRAARAYVWEVYGEAQRVTESGSELDEELYQRLLQATTYAHDICAEVTRFAYRWCGTMGLRQPSGIGIALLDTFTATQHKYADNNTYVEAAPALLAAIDAKDATRD